MVYCGIQLRLVCVRRNFSGGIQYGDKGDPFILIYGMQLGKISDRTCPEQRTRSRRSG